MKISTKGRYGLRALLDLAVNSNGEHVALSNIAERQGISENYLEQVFSSLRKAGIIKSVKGAQGGYVLAEKPGNIRVGSILRVLEGDLSVVQDDGDHPQNYYESIQYCLKLKVWDKMSESINNFVDSLTLEDLVQDYKTLNNDIGDMYYI